MRVQSQIAVALALLLTSSLALYAAGPATLVDAVRFGDRAAALEMIAKGVDVNAASPDGSTALGWAVQRDDLDLVQRLLKAGAKVNVRNENGASPMSVALPIGNAAIIELLLQGGADPNAANADGFPPLMVLARTRHAAAAEVLIKHGAAVSFKERQKNQTALMWAAAENQPEIVKVLVAHGADVNARTVINNTATANYSTVSPREWPSNVSTEPRAGPRAPGGLTPMLYATREGCAECVKTMLAAGANPDLPDPEGITPLIMAITNMHFDTAAVLIKAGANVDRWDLWGRSPIYCAVDVNTVPHGGRADRPSLDNTTSLEIIEMLLKAGANPNLQLKLLPPYRNLGNDRGLDGMLTIGSTALLRAAKALDAPAVRLLVEHGAILDLGNNRGITPVMAAAGIGSTDADTRGVYTTEDTPLRSIATLEILLKAGADVNTRDSGGQSLLASAAFWGWNPTVEYLVGKGARLDVQDNRRMTLIDYSMGKARGNSRGGQRNDVHEDTAALLRKLMGPSAPPQ
jgi:ankyrin repeat protein